MKLFQFRADGQRRLGAELGSQLVDLSVAYSAMRSVRPRAPEAVIALPADLMTYLALGTRGRLAAQEALRFMTGRPALPVDVRAAYIFDEVAQLAPLARPGKLLSCAPSHPIGTAGDTCGGLRLADLQCHAKLPNTIVGPAQAILHPGSDRGLECHPAFGVVIGREMPRRTPPERLLEYVAGFTLVNDVAMSPRGSRPCCETLSVNGDTFCPLGPCVVTIDELTPDQPLPLRVTVNGQLRWDSIQTLKTLCIEPLLHGLSQILSLNPGDVIAVRWPVTDNDTRIDLGPGDVVKIEVGGVGALENTVLSPQ